MQLDVSSRSPACHVAAAPQLPSADAPCVVTYRPDIDGLRAWAVLSVVLFHASAAWVPSGFVGVDVFFVISGYLITFLMQQELAGGQFQLGRFYARRIRRLFPTLLLVLGGTALIGWRWMMPDEYALLGRHLLAGAGFVSNWVLMRENGYFDVTADYKPLLHLWSLAVEEQFYALWPCVVLLIHRWRWRSGVVVLGVMTLSMVYNLNAVQVNAFEAFFSPLTRCWELMVGAMIAVSNSRGSLFSGGPVLKQAYADALSFLGFALLLASFFVIDPSAGYPGVSAVLPVAAAASLIVVGPRAWINRVILAHPMSVHLGLISYALYLWHWPILSWLAISGADGDEMVPRLAALVLAWVLAEISYRWLERPIRRSPHGKAWVLGLVLLMVGVGLFGAYVERHDGLMSRLQQDDAPATEALIQVAKAWQFRDYPVPDVATRDATTGYVQFSGAQGAGKVLMLGDSHTQQYWHAAPTLLASLPANSAPTWLFSHQEAFPPNIDQRVLADASVRVVALSYFWSYRYGSDQVNQAIRCCGGGPGGAVGHSGAGIVPLRTTAQMDELDRSLIASVRQLQQHGKKVVLVLDNPFGEAFDPRHLLQRSWRGIAISPTLLTRQQALARQEPVRSRLLNIAQQLEIRVIDPVAALCDDAICPAFSQAGYLIYKDYDHISIEAARSLTGYLQPILSLD